MTIINNSQSVRPAGRMTARPSLDLNAHVLGAGSAVPTAPTSGVVVVANDSRGDIPERAPIPEIESRVAVADMAERQTSIDEDLARLRANAFGGATEAAAAPTAGGDIDPYGLYLNFVSSNPSQRLLDQVLTGQFPPEFLEGPAGQLQLMVLQDAMQQRTNFMNMLSNIMKKNDEAASTVIGNMR